MGKKGGGKGKERRLQKREEKRERRDITPIGIVKKRETQNQTEPNPRMLINPLFLFPP